MLLLGPFGVQLAESKGRMMVKSYSVGFELSMSSHSSQASNSTEAWTMSNAPQLRDSAILFAP